MLFELDQALDPEHYSWIYVMIVFSITIFLFPFSSLFVTPRRMVLAIKLSAGLCVLHGRVALQRLFLEKTVAFYGSTHNVNAAEISLPSY